MNQEEDNLYLEEIPLTGDSRIDSIDQITKYSQKDNNISSAFFQGLRHFGGNLIICASIPFGCIGMGPIVTVPEGNRAAVLKFGKLIDVKPPGTYVFNVGSEEYKIVNVQIQTMVIPKQTVITKDGISTTVDAVCFYRIFDDD